MDTLAEHDTLYVGRPFRATFTELGTLIVIDQFANRLVEFDRAGRLLRAIGREGRGPGEFLAPVAIERWGRDTLSWLTFGRGPSHCFALDQVTLSAG